MPHENACFAVQLWAGVRQLACVQAMHAWGAGEDLGKACCLSTQGSVGWVEQGSLSIIPAHENQHLLLLMPSSVCL